jgi:hypothetical protein
MDDPMPDPDPLDDLLGPKPAPPPSAEVLAGTLRVLRRRRQVRRLGGVAVLATTYAAGLLTVLAFQPPAPAPPPVVRVGPPAEPRLGKKVERARTAVPAPAEPAQQEVTADGAALLYRQAGDLFLAEDDPAEAVRCYGNSLDNGRTIDLEVKAEDTWLLMAIKTARKKESKP